ncbi:MAG: hypothetical protein GX421_06000 [Caldisericales bacterium]|nr:hypothetical protein [Caldisericales bacterium]
MKKLILFLLVFVLIFPCGTHAQIGEKIIDSELALVSPGMVVDWRFEGKVLLDGFYKGVLEPDGTTAGHVWAGQGCVNDYCFSEEGGSPDPIIQGSSLRCQMRFFVPSDFSGEDPVSAKLRIVDPSGQDFGSGILYMMLVKPVKAYFVAGEKPVLVREIEMDGCTPGKTISEKTMTAKTAPTIVSGNMMIPFRLLGEIIDAEVGWNNSIGEASYVMGPKKVLLKKGIDKARLVYPNLEKTLAMSAAPVNIKGNIMVPLRFVSTALGGSVEWDQFTNTAIVTFPGCSS